MNVGQAFGELQLRITELEECGVLGADLGLQDELDRAKRDALAFGLQLTAAKKEIETLQATVHALRMTAKAVREQPAAPVRKGAVSSVEVALREEITAQESRLRAALEQAADYKRHIERMEVEVCSLKERNRNQADMLASLRDVEGKLVEAQARIDELESRPPEIVAKPPPPSECPTCAPIIRSITQAVQASNDPKAAPMAKPSEMLPAVPRPSVGRSTLTGIRRRVLDALIAAPAPVDAKAIADATGLTCAQAHNAARALMDDRVVVRLAPRPQDRRPGRRGMPGSRYWPADRRLPEGEHIEGESAC